MAALESAGLGKGWTHNYVRYLLFNGPTPLALVRGNGYQEFLSRTASGVYDSVSSSRIRLTSQTDVWVASLRDGSKEFYNTAGQLTGTATASGSTTTLAYQGNRLTSITGPHGHTLQLEYEGDHLARVRGPDNQFVTYHYDAQGRLTSLDYPDTTTRTYHYEDAAFPNQLTGITSAGGIRYSTYTYDSLGRAVSSEHAGGAQGITLAYAPTSTTVTDSALGTTTYALSSAAGIRRIVGINHNGLSESFVREALTGRITEAIDAKGFVTRYTYDTVHPLTKTEAFGTPRARMITTAWHPTFRLPTQIDEPGKGTTFTHDASGNVESKTVLDTTTSTSRTWSYTYNSLGQVLTEDGPRTDVVDRTTYTYYNCTTGYQCGQVHTITGALSHVTTYNSYNAHGQPLTITDPNGVATTLTYDLRQRLTSRMVGTELELTRFRGLFTVTDGGVCHGQEGNQIHAGVPATDRRFGARWTSAGAAGA